VVYVGMPFHKFFELYAPKTYILCHLRIYITADINKHGQYTTILQ